MLDAFDAGLDRPAYGFRGIGVHGHIGAPVVGGLDRGLHLVQRVLRHIQRVVGRGGAAAGHDLDLGRAGAQVFTGRGQYLVPAIGDEAHAHQFASRNRTTEPAGTIARHPEVTVAGGLRDHRAAWVDARPDVLALVDRPLDTEYRAAHVPGGSESAQQHLLRFIGCFRFEGPEACLGVHHFRLRTGAHEDVHMHVAHPWHQRPATAVDEGHRLAGIGLDRFGTDPGNPVVDDEDVRRRGELRIGAIEDAHVADQHLAWRGRRRSLHGRGCGRRGRSASDRSAGRFWLILHGGGRGRRLVGAAGERQQRRCQGNQNAVAHLACSNEGQSVFGTVKNNGRLRWNVLSMRWPARAPDVRPRSNRALAGAGSNWIRWAICWLARHVAVTSATTGIPALV